MHVRDDSIYIPRSEEILPLNKPLYMMKTYRGPVGVPVWCPTYTDAVRVFGADTFNKRSKYFSENAYYLLKTFPFNGAFIMRVASETAEDSRISIEVGLSLEASRVKITDPETGKQYYGGFNTENPIVPQYKRDSNGNFVLELTGAKIPINEAGKSPEEWVEEGESIDTWSQAMLPGYKVAWRAVCRGADDKRELGSATTTEAGGYTWYPMLCKYVYLFCNIFRSLICRIFGIIFRSFRFCSRIFGLIQRIFSTFFRLRLQFFLRCVLKACGTMLVLLQHRQFADQVALFVFFKFVFNEDLVAFGILFVVDPAHLQGVFILRTLLVAVD